jgi:glycerol uptake facilitator-like aquaporin
MPWRHVAGYVGSQLIGAVAGVAMANAMFGEPLLTVSQHVRSGAAQLFSEFIATFGLLSVILGCSRFRPHAVGIAVGAYITAGYWFASSTSFANPAVTLARTMTNTFSGIQPASAPGFIASEFLGAFAAITVWSWLVPAVSKTGPEIPAHRVERQSTHA